FLVRNKERLFAADQDHVLVYDLPANVTPPSICDSLTAVGVRASPDTVTVGGQVVLTASVKAGRGTSTSFLFASDGSFLHTLTAASADSVVTLSADALARGANTFYVKMQTTNNCGSVLTAVDSVTVVRLAAIDTTGAGTDSVQVKAGPNPFAGSFTVMGLDASRAYSILIANSQGMRIYATQVTGVTTMPIEGLSLKQGVYWLEVYDKATGKRVQKIELLKIP
ncbi:MAG TPA: T9SS type A sorting domain-containing protein, partial [Puia sp.]|nr:T9SS type A sorting domain-containing protein [Puia sp.]